MRFLMDSNYFSNLPVTEIGYGVIKYVTDQNNDDQKWLKMINSLRYILLQRGLILGNTVTRDSCSLGLLEFRIKTMDKRVIAGKQDYDSDLQLHIQKPVNLLSALKEASIPYQRISNDGKIIYPYN